MQNATRKASKFTERLIVFGVCGFVFGVLFVAPVTQVTDSSYSMLMSEVLVNAGSIDLAPYVEKKQPYSAPGVVHTGYPYQLEPVGNELYYYFPHGTAFLAAPLVAVLNKFGLSAVNGEGGYNRQGEAQLERIAAALFCAVSVGLVYLVSRVFLKRNQSLVIAVSAAFGTSLFSTASRALWSHTGLVVLLLWAMYIITLGLREKDRKPNPYVLGTIASWMYFVRPTASISILAITVVVFVYFRPVFWRYVLVGLAWLGAFVAYSYAVFGTALPSYYLATRLGSDTFWTALLGNLISPARGLFVYSPVLLVLILGFLFYGKRAPHKRLLTIAALGILVHLLVISTFPHWWAGYSYGPRLMTDVIPWFVVLATGLAAAMENHNEETSSATAQRAPYGRSFLALGAVSICLSVFMNGMGAFDKGTFLWNGGPPSVDESPKRLWDWKQPQFLGGGAW